MRGRIGVRVPLLSSRGLSLDELEWLYRTKGAAFERLAIALAGDEGRGCDAVQEAFVRAIRNRGRFRGSGTAEAWMWRIVINEAHRRRDAERDTPIPPEDLDAGAEVTNAAGADRALIRARIAALPERQRLALFLRYYADLDYSGIAEALEIRPGTVAATLNAAHARLAHDLQEVREWEI
jgi:RNA polymerase sigma factor (sigma-70 family)